MYLNPHNTGLNRIFPDTSKSNDLSETFLPQWRPLCTWTTTRVTRSWPARCGTASSARRVSATWRHQQRGSSHRTRRTRSWSWTRYCMSWQVFLVFLFESFFTFLRRGVCCCVRLNFLWFAERFNGIVIKVVMIIKLLKISYDFDCLTVFFKYYLLVSRTKFR